MDKQHPTEKSEEPSQVSAIFEEVINSWDPDVQERFHKEGIIPYDLTSQDRIVRGRMPTLEIIHDRLVRMFRITLSGALRQPVDMRVKSIELEKFGDFLSSLPVPAALSLYRMNPLKGTCIHVMRQDLIFKLLELFYGGSGRTKKYPDGRDFTPMEQRLNKRIVIAFLEDMQTAWKPVFPIQFSYQRVEINPKFVAVVPQSAVVLVLTFELIFEDQTVYPITICVPYEVIEPLRPILDTGFSAAKSDNQFMWEERITDTLSDSQLEVSAEIQGKPMTIQRLINLKEGDMILTDQNVDQTFDIKINGVKKMTGRLKEKNKRQVLEVSEIKEARVNDKIELLRKEAIALKGES